MIHPDVFELDRLEGQAKQLFTFTLGQNQLHQCGAVYQQLARPSKSTADYFKSIAEASSPAPNFAYLIIASLAGLDDTEVA